MKRILFLLFPLCLLGATQAPRFNSKVSVECDMEVKSNEVIFGNPRLYINGRPAECKCGQPAWQISVKSDKVVCLCVSHSPKKKVAKSDALIALDKVMDASKLQSFDLDKELKKK